MSELGHLRKKPPDDGGLLLDTKDRRLKRECEEFGVTFYIGPEETLQQRNVRRATLRRSIKNAKTKMRRLEEKGGEREQVRLQKQALRQDLLRQTETEGAWEARLQKQALRQYLLRQTETEGAREARLQKQALRQDLLRQTETEGAREAHLQADRANKESKRKAETEDAREARLQADRANKESKREAETEDAREARLQADQVNKDHHEVSVYLL